MNLKQWLKCLCRDGGSIRFLYDHYTEEYIMHVIVPVRGRELGSVSVRKAVKIDDSEIMTNQIVNVISEVYQHSELDDNYSQVIRNAE